jgi:hypothetical protein
MFKCGLFRSNFSLAIVRISWSREVME